MKRIAQLILSFAIVLSCHFTYAQEAEAQFINNSLDTPERVDIYINNERQAFGLNFRWYTNYLPIPVGADLEFEVRATGSDPTSPPLVSETYTIEEDGSYTIILNGLAGGSGDDGLTFSVFDDADRSGSITGTEYLGTLHHGVTNAGRLNVFDGENELDQPNIVYRLAYNESTDFATVLQKSETFVIKDTDIASETIGVFPYDAIPADIGGGITVVASGIVGSTDPDQAFALVVYRQPSEGGPGRVISNLQPTATDEFDGKTFFINVGFNRCVEVLGASKRRGTNVVIWDRNDQAHQQWKFTAVGDGYYEIRNLNSDRCMDVAGASTEANANVLQWDCNGQANQQFKVENIGAGRYRLTARHNGQNIEVEEAGNFNGGNVQQHDERFYYFMLEEVDGAEAARTADEFRQTERPTSDELMSFPNPVGSTLNLKMPADFSEQGAEIQVFSSTGQLLMTQKLSKKSMGLDVENLKAGNYLVKIMSKGELFTTRFLKK